MTRTRTSYVGACGHLYRRRTLRLKQVRRTTCDRRGAARVKKPRPALGAAGWDSIQPLEVAPHGLAVHLGVGEFAPGDQVASQRAASGIAPGVSGGGNGVIAAARGC